jgi:hypothetical protein
MRPVALAAAVCLCLSAGAAGRARADVAIDSLRATVRLHGGSRSSTAFAVAVPDDGGGSPRIVLVTAAHSFETIAAATCTAAFRARGGDGFVRRDVQLTIRDGDRPRWARHPTADVAMIPVVPPADTDLEPFPLERLADGPAFDRGEVHVGQRAWIACYPAKTEANPTGWAVLRQGAIASHPLAPVAKVPTFFVDYAHFGGDSGAAVVVEREGRPLVSGVVVSMQRQTDTITSPFEDRKIHTPLGLAIVVPADRVVETIGLWRNRDRDVPAGVTPRGR